MISPIKTDSVPAWQLVQKFLFSSSSVALTNRQGHSDYSQNATLSGGYHHAKFESNQFMNVQMHAKR